MRTWSVICALCATACWRHHPLGPVAPSCAYSDAGTQTYQATAHVTEFTSQAEPVSPVQVSLHTAWDIAGIFPTTCAPLAQLAVGTAQGFVAAFPPTAGPPATVVALIVRGTGLADSINDKRVAPCLEGCVVGSQQSPYPIWVLASDVLAAWEQHAGLADLDWGSTVGLAVVTYRDADGQPAAGVTPVRQVGGKLEPLVPDKEVFFLAADRRTIVAGAATSESGTALIPLVAGRALSISGTLPGSQYERLNIAAQTGAIFFEQVDLAPL